MSRRSFYLFLGTAIGVVLGCICFLVPTVRAVQHQQQQINRQTPVVTQYQGVVQ